ncbi:mediator of DNA damage checkpoint protein 1, partial [Biomphalaria pfeifferi]
VSFLKVVLQCGLQETSYPLYEGDNIIGRSSDTCHICISSKSLSKEHACIQIVNDTHMIFDKRSRNKTRRGKLLLLPDVRYELKDQDEIYFADVKCIYLLPSEESPAKSLDHSDVLVANTPEAEKTSVVQTLRVSDSESEPELDRIKLRIEETVLCEDSDHDSNDQEVYYGATQRYPNVVSKGQNSDDEDSNLSETFPLQQKEDTKLNNSSEEKSETKTSDSGDKNFEDDRGRREDVGPSLFSVSTLACDTTVTTNQGAGSQFAKEGSSVESVDSETLKVSQAVDSADISPSSESSTTSNKRLRKRKTQNKTDETLVDSTLVLVDNLTTETHEVSAKMLRMSPGRRGRPRGAKQNRGSQRKQKECLTMMDEDFSNEATTQMLQTSLMEATQDLRGAAEKIQSSGLKPSSGSQLGDDTEDFSEASEDRRADDLNPNGESRITLIDDTQDFRGIAEKQQQADLKSDGSSQPFTVMDETQECDKSTENESGDEEFGTEELTQAYALGCDSSPAEESALDETQKYDMIENDENLAVVNERESHQDKKDIEEAVEEDISYDDSDVEAESVLKTDIADLECQDNQLSDESAGDNRTLQLDDDINNEDGTKLFNTKEQNENLQDTICESPVKSTEEVISDPPLSSLAKSPHKSALATKRSPYHSPTPKRVAFTEDALAVKGHDVNSYSGSPSEKSSSEQILIITSEIISQVAEEKIEIHPVGDMKATSKNEFGSLQNELPESVPDVAPLQPENSPAVKRRRGRPSTKNPPEKKIVSVVQETEINPAQETQIGSRRSRKSQPGGSASVVTKTSEEDIMNNSCLTGENTFVKQKNVKVTDAASEEHNSDVGNKDLDSNVNMASSSTDEATPVSTRRKRVSTHPAYLKDFETDQSKVRKSNSEENSLDGSNSIKSIGRKSARAVRSSLVKVQPSDVDLNNSTSNGSIKAQPEPINTDKKSNDFFETSSTSNKNQDKSLQAASTPTESFNEVVETFNSLKKTLNVESASAAHQNSEELVELCNIVNAKPETENLKITNSLESDDIASTSPTNSQESVEEASTKSVRGRASRRQSKSHSNVHAAVKSSTRAQKKTKETIKSTDEAGNNKNVAAESSSKGGQIGRNTREATHSNNSSDEQKPNQQESRAQKKTVRTCKTKNEVESAVPEAESSGDDREKGESTKGTNTPTEEHKLRQSSKRAQKKNKEPSKKESVKLVEGSNSDGAAVVDMETTEVTPLNTQASDTPKSKRTSARSSTAVQSSVQETGSQSSDQGTKRRTRKSEIVPAQSTSNVDQQADGHFSKNGEAASKANKKATSGSSKKVTPPSSQSSTEEKSTTCSPSLRKSSLCPKPKVMFTGLVDEPGEKIVKDLGGEIATAIQDCTHLVTDKVRRTVKFLSGLSRGIPIVSPHWLENSKRAGTFLDCHKFLVSDLAMEKQYKFTLSSSITKAASVALLKDYKIHVTKSVKPNPEQMQEILVCAGAAYLKSMPNKVADKTVVISCPEDKKLYQPAIKCGIPIVEAEFLLTGILRQELDAKQFALFPEDNLPTEKRKKK